MLDAMKAGKKPLLSPRVVSSSALLFPGSDRDEKSDVSILP